ncbi:DUF2267 domain-containing protein [Streptomyces sp. SID4985]|uniref:DUF2267 domain-containing protein n=1 Tax=Streptomyces sp. SID4985 TaxID=2690292 RepID=UPI00136EE593|nr:DUF2267 domain-containing protein [Streptomyces sp. SID4985]MYQ45405.1 DUF2267 domain-containing protein [Streptomyces sp. SID4985]
MTLTTPHPRTTIPAPLSLTDAVREVGQYGTRTEAATVTRTVLTSLAAHLPPEHRAPLSAALPPETAHPLLTAPPAPHPLTAREFVDSVAAGMEVPSATARWHVTSVLTALSCQSDVVTTLLLACLPPGYALLFGRAELAAAG